MLPLAPQHGPDDEEETSPVGATRCARCGRWYRAPACPMCPREKDPDVPRCKCPCGEADAMGHTFGEDMRCNTCRRSYEEHQAGPATCEMKHTFNKKDHCRDCGVSRKQHNRKPAACRHKGKS